MGQLIEHINGTNDKMEVKLGKSPNFRRGIQDEFDVQEVNLRSRGSNSYARPQFSCIEFNHKI
jgi:hypothetical protein